jgi:hypothetical protein
MSYLRSLYGHKSFIHRVLARMRLLRRFYTKRKRRLSLSAIQCESHREALLDILAENTPGVPGTSVVFPEAAEEEPLDAVATDLT